METDSKANKYINTSLARMQRGLVTTVRKNGINALDDLRRVFLGDPILPAVNTS